MGALGLALFSALSWGTADFFGGLTTRRFGILLVGVISQGAGLILTGRPGRRINATDRDA